MFQSARCNGDHLLEAMIISKKFLIKTDFFIILREQELLRTACGLIMFESHHMGVYHIYVIDMRSKFHRRSPDLYIKFSYSSNFPMELSQLSSNSRFNT